MRRRLIPGKQIRLAVVTNAQVILVANLSFHIYNMEVLDGKLTTRQPYC
jgi:hypothetical protein